jgi:colicin import membrane protein
MSTDAADFDPTQDVSSMDDIAKLAALAANSGDDEHEDTAGEAPAADATGGDDGGEAQDASDGDQGQATDDDGEPAGIQARDGKHVLPWERFEEVQQRAEQAEQARAAMEQRLAALETQLQQAGGQAQEGADTTQQAGSQAGEGGDQAGEQPSVDAVQTELSELRAEYDEIKDDDPQLARSYRASIASLERQLSMQQELEQLRTLTSGMHDAYQRQQQQAQAAAQAEVTQALDANPVTKAWLAEQDGPWMERMQTVEQQMLQVPDSKVAQAQTWDERIAAVVDAVHAAYGLSPAAEAAAKAAPKASGKADSKPQDSGSDDLPPPASMAGITGELASQGETDLGRFERMSPAQILAHFNSLPEEQRQAQVGRLA